LSEVWLWAYGRIPRGITVVDTPVCSVVVTCYNYGDFLPGCLDSVFAQTYQDFEIVVVNDGSSDSTDQEVQKYLADSRIRYIRQDNAGQARAKNVGIQQARGDFVAFLDADDLWDAHKLKKQMQLFKDPEVGVVFSRAKYIDKFGSEIPFTHTSRYMRPRRGWVAKHLAMDNFVPFSSSVVRRECLERIGGFNEDLQMAIDWDLWLRISVVYSFQFADEPFLLYRVGHSGQMSRHQETRIRCADKILSEFEKSNPSIVSPLFRRRIDCYSFANRGRHYRYMDWKKSTRYFIEAIGRWPFAINPYRGLLKNALIRYLGHQ
jgi:glycosyltransferase involved in cell wall biosynthesis